jgi:peptidoglycan/xylan/chitin deacetylase (PgdA/CDA1 family)
MTEPEGSSIVGVESSSGSVVLTYDDGPTPGVTDRLLTALAEADATATFFVLLTRVRRHLALLQELLAAGHEIGLHGPDHRRLTTLPPETRSALPRILREAKDELEGLASVPVRWFRPPYGAQDAGTWHAVREAGLTPVLWTLDCQDWLTRPLEDQLANVRTAPLAGSIVLLHDGYADADDGVDDGPPPVLDRPALTSAVLTEVRAAGLEARSLGNALVSTRPTWRPWFDEG